MQLTHSIINRLVQEHLTLTEDAQTLEQTAHGASELKGLEQIQAASETINLFKLQELLKEMMRKLHLHFIFEESGLLVALQTSEENNLTSAFSLLFLEHGAIRNSFNSAIQDVTKLINEKSTGGDSVEVRITSLQAGIRNIRELLEDHVRKEQVLLKEIKDRMG